MKLPRVTGDKVLRALQRAGFSLVHTKGSHHFLHNAEKDCLVTVPVHSGATLAPKTLKSILLQAQITIDEFVALL
jgi:predicted RNA binding protein YcfA (HicA-like mRNA interferase family)